MQAWLGIFGHHSLRENWKSVDDTIHNELMCWKIKMAMWATLNKPF